MTFILVFFLLSVLGTHIGLYKIFERAGIPAWKALVPIVNKIEWIKLTGRPKKDLIYCLIPVVNLFTGASLMVDLLKAHRIYGFAEHYLGIIFSAVYFPYVGFVKKPVYIAPNGVEAGKSAPKESTAREWTDSIVFAICAAAIIRMFVFEPYTIPTSSLEGSLLVGDFLFVDKFMYGTRVPNTPIAFPLVHNTLPLTNNKLNSYLEWIKLPYKRFNVITPIERNDLVVFNYPEGDTVTQQFQSARSYYEMCAEEGRENVLTNYPISTRPVDKKDNYIKRCVGIPGDVLEIKNGTLFINNAPAYEAPKLQTSYTVRIDPTKIQTEAAFNKSLMDLDVNINDVRPISNTEPVIMINTSKDKIAQIKQLDYVVSVTPDTFTYAGNEMMWHGMFPHDRKNYAYTVDNYGPITVPKKGATVTLTENNIAQYERVIQNYEGNTLEKKDGKFFINGKETTTYTFKLDHYFMMGDNRHNSQDSRYWGCVPEDHIVGRPWFIFMSWDAQKKTIRWNRLFKSIKSNFTPN